MTLAESLVWDYRIVEAALCGVGAYFLTVEIVKALS